MNSEEACELLVASVPDFKESWNDHLSENYEGEGNRAYYLDMSAIAGFVVEHMKSGNTKHFEDFFKLVETILESADDELQDLMVVGLLEAIQNAGGNTVNYESYAKWLKPETKKRWDEIIMFG